MILKGFKTIFREHDDVPKHVMLDPFLEQLIVNLREHKKGQNLMKRVKNGLNFPKWIKCI